MFKRRDIPPVLLLLALIVLVMLTLCQILVVHRGRYDNNVRQLRRMQRELYELDANIRTLMTQDVPSVELHRRLLQNKLNEQRFARIVAEASSSSLSSLHQRKHSSKSEPVDEYYRQSARDTDAGAGKAGEELGSYPELGANLPDSDSAPAGNYSDISERRAPLLTVNASARRRLPQPPNDRNYDKLPDGGDDDADDDADDVALTHKRSTTTARMTTPTTGSTLASDIDHVAQSARRRSDGDHSLRRDPSSSAPGSAFLQLNGSSQASTLTAATSLSANTSTTGRYNRDLLYCPPVPPSLVGRQSVSISYNESHAAGLQLQMRLNLSQGGHWHPENCVARHRLAIIIPFRDRHFHLFTLLAHLHPLLQRQQLHYTIFVVEQVGENTFNKARIMNVGFVEALKLDHFHCFVFHDVDLVPEDDRNMYSCPSQPRHMSVAIDEMGYKLAYEELVGGVLNLKTEHFHKVNGYSNLYWGWGAEDDDMAFRIMHVGLKITRPPTEIARYTMIKHTKQKPSDWRKRAKLLVTGTRRFQFDGLNTLQYSLVKIEKKPFYTHILVDIGKPPRGF